MIVRARPTLWDILFTLRGSIVMRIRGRLAAIALLAALAVVLTEHLPRMLGQMGAIPFTLIGLALSIFMSFRNSACYDRWWEGRKFWGQALVETRSLSRALASLPVARRAPLQRQLCGFLHGLAARLRGGDELGALARYVEAGPLAAAPNPTDALLRQVGEGCAALLREGVIGEQRYVLLETRLHGLTQMQGGCERIKATPLPFAYSLLLHRTALLFCVLLPFGMAATLGWWTPAVGVIVAYTFFGLDALGDELEDPFGEDVNDLPLEAMVRQMERELLAAAGETELPAALGPVRFVLR